MLITLCAYWLAFTLIASTIIMIMERKLNTFISLISYSVTAIPMLVLIIYAITNR